MFHPSPRGIWEQGEGQQWGFSRISLQPLLPTPHDLLPHALLSRHQFPLTPAEAGGGVGAHDRLSAHLREDFITSCLRMSPKGSSESRRISPFLTPLSAHSPSYPLN